ncbi:MAG: hydrogenase maturation protease [Dehalococcoidia bacterium]|nr:hydrogenase maturation protease [Dehalococcoidia bacterium]
MLVGGVGYRFTRDLAFGPLMIDRLRREAWARGVEVEDLSYAPVAIVQRWMDAPPDRLILIGAVPRDGRTPGTFVRYCPSVVLPPPDEIQVRIGEALTGIISLDNLVIAAKAFGTLPRDVEVLEVEPVDHGWGEGLSTPIQAAASEALTALRELLAPADSQDPVARLRRRDDLLQLLYWMEGERFAADVSPADLRPFLDWGIDVIGEHLEALCRTGFVERTGEGEGRYRLTVTGVQEGRRRFLEEFRPLLGRAHGECNDPDCECQRTGDSSLCTNPQARWSP